MFLWELKAPAAKPSIPVGKEAFEKIDETRIYWLGAATFLINARGTIIMFDPVMQYKEGSDTIAEIDDAPLKIKYPIMSYDVPRCDAVFYSHSDDDHLARGTAKTLAKLQPKFYGPPPVFEKLARTGIDLDLVESCRSEDVFEFENCKITVFPADHPWQLQDPRTKGKIFRSGDSVGYIVDTPDIRFFYPGDTRFMEQHLYMQGIELLATDVSLCTYHINPLGAAMMANIMKDALLLPYHYGTFDEPDVPAHCGDPLDVMEMTDNGKERMYIQAPGQPMCFKDHKLVKY